MSRSSEAVKRWRNNTKTRMLIAMGSQCVCCGYDRCDDALEFHHLDSEEKEFGVGASRANPKNWLSIVEELRKCVLLCAICHREVHAGIREIPADATRFDEKCVDYQNGIFEVIMDTCPVCKGSKDTSKLTCSMSCAASYRVQRSDQKPATPKIAWSSIDLEKELKTNSYDDIAERLGCSNAAVWKRAIKMGFTYKKPSIWDNHDLEQLMHTTSMSKISKIIGCSEAAVRKRVHKMNLTHLIQHIEKASH